MCATSTKEAERAALDEMDTYYIVTQTEIQVVQLRYLPRAGAPVAVSMGRNWHLWSVWGWPPTME